MPIPVEDLIASLTSSFKSNHIGQEAADLATLQTQLTQTLNYTQQPLSYGSSSHAQPPNTPTQSTVLWNFQPNTGPLDSNPLHRRIKPHRRDQRRSHSINEDPEESMVIDEAEVEELLDTHGPTLSHYTSITHRDSQTLRYHSATSHVAEQPSSPISTFAATDPFYTTLASRNPPYQSHHTSSVIAPQTAFLGHVQPVHANH